MNRPVLMTLSAAAVLALTACGGSQGPSLSSQSFDSAADLRAAVEDRGVSCDAGRLTEGEGFKESLKCGENVWLTVFEGSADKQERVETYKEKKSTFVEGPNWVVVGPRATLDKISG